MILEKSESIYPLTVENYKLLKKTYFLHWTVFKRILISLGLIFVVAEVWLGWVVYFSAKLPTAVDQDSFLSVSYLVGGIGLLTAAITGGYRKRFALVLMQDLQEGRKIRKTGCIVAIKIQGEYGAINLVFKSNNSSELENFVIQPPRPPCFSYDEVIPGREIVLEYAPYSRVLLQLKPAYSS